MQNGLERAERSKPKHFSILFEEKALRARESA
jgi:hypothetical protein